MLKYNLILIQSNASLQKYETHEEVMGTINFVFNYVWGWKEETKTASGLKTE